MWVIPVVVVALLVFAAAADWHARRSGKTYRTGADYWRAVAEARKEERTRMFSLRRRFGP